MPLRVGDILKYSHPQPGESDIRCILRELNGDRVLVESHLRLADKASRNRRDRRGVSRRRAAGHSIAAVDAPEHSARLAPWHGAPGRLSINANPSRLAFLYPVRPGGLRERKRPHRVSRLFRRLAPIRTRRRGRQTSWQIAARLSPGRSPPREKALPPRRRQISPGRR